ncbi:thiol reductant ABC exporter subunit CydC [Fructilactobacillus lindneri]|uniref:ATP-binding permease cydD n=1 Tax=Fructilactobacillus lindneri DSM 20690 = JCM 11027 TaxID=1122148 RepID=A0A0R2JQ69_9LACO|nr:thiol reductant ABC exporter subunit CydC [Fructilactobacillus lindneri]KRN79240.1 ATP-binding permease cydD [Fructilactobacillus lindneri DSM 20690 = JCM 11027]POH07873.1 thiol reductant ABC exporter subunit CydC [Fructilactobacillus lindneri]POH08025.1 thiol reductant ABC exporter subunit CydC [Fructilactobacillus lindneri]POH24539.1 thiol reductant ABC exporter subunit CydC [Fructilactobacillus lindneri DSM 20690 = JCM 11027]SJZ71620.1 ATP-binding cassette, subfamily C, CydC [Fructilacto
MKKIFKNDSWIKPYLKKYKGLLALVFFLGVITFICSIGLMFTAGYLISRSAQRPYNILLVFVPVIITEGFGIFRPVFKYLERINSHNWVLKVTSNLRKRLYETLEKQAMFLDQKFKTGDLLSVLADDIDHLENLYLRTIFPLIVAYLTGIILIIILGIVSWVYALFMLFTFSLILLVIPLISVAVRGASLEYQKTLLHDSYNNLTDATLGIGDWMISGRKKGFLQQTTKNDTKLSASTFKTHRFEWNRDFVIKLIFGIMVVGTLIWTNFALTSSARLADYVAAFVLGVFPLVDAFAPVSQAMEEWPMYRDSVIRLNQLSDDDTTEPNVPQTDLSPSEFKNIEMKNVTFHYQGDSLDLLKNVSLKVLKGQKTAIIGPSGVGKTTLLQLLLGALTPTNGEVTINETVDVAALQNNRSNWFSVLDQKPFLFKTSVLNNVRIGNENATDTQVEQALADVGMKNFVNSLPNGIYTDVSENGVRFSGGQRQRLALARILLQDNPIVLLDEPTVGLDPITENDLIKTLEQVLKNKTVIWVTHHLQGLDTMNQIIFLEDGVIKMAGNPSSLYKNNPRFRQLTAMDQGLPFKK